MTKPDVIVALDEFKTRVMAQHNCEAGLITAIEGLTVFLHEMEGIHSAHWSWQCLLEKLSPSCDGRKETQQKPKET